MGHSSVTINVVDEPRGLHGILRLPPRSIGLIIFTIRSSQYSNNLIEQDRPDQTSLGSITRIQELSPHDDHDSRHRTDASDQEGEFKLVRLHVHGKTAPEISSAVLAE
jgi:hypothetical protein